jgi:hypothetical protein
MSHETARLGCPTLGRAEHYSTWGAKALRKSFAKMEKNTRHGRPRDSGLPVIVSSSILAPYV